MLLLWAFLTLIGAVISGIFFLKGALAIGNRFSIPPFILGVTLVAMGTSSQELFISLLMPIDNFHDTYIVSIVGSGIVNILLGIGLAALFGAIIYDKTDYTVCFGMLYNTIFTILFISTLVLTKGKISSFFSILILVIYLIFISINIAFFLSKEKGVQSDFISYNSDSVFILKEQYNSKRFIISIAFFIGGIIGLNVFSDLVISLTINLKDEFIVPKKVIASIVLGLGNSLPEIIVSILAVLKKQSKVALGNIIGSNLFIIGGLLGTVGIITNIRTEKIIALDLPSFILDIPFLLLATLLLFVCFKIKSGIGKITGLIFIFIYLIYTLLQLNII